MSRKRIRKQINVLLSSEIENCKDLIKICKKILFLERFL
jgi:hypothetical protein